MSIPLHVTRQRGYEPIVVSIAIIALVINGWLSYRNTQRLREHDQWVNRSQEAMYTIESFQGALIDAETGGRGFLLTGDELFLTPFEQGGRIAMAELAAVEELTSSNFKQKAAIPKIRQATVQALAQIAEAVQKRRERELSVAELKAIAVGGKSQMDETRSLVKQFHAAERALLAERRLEAVEINTSVFVTTLFSNLAGMALVVGMFYLVYRSRSKAEQAADEIFAERERLKKTQEEKLLTDRKLAAFVEQVSDYAIFLISPDLKAATWNRGVEQVMGYTEEEFIGRDIIDAIFLHESLLDGTAQREFEIARETGDATADRWMKRRNGERFWASGITTAVHDADGKLLGYNKVLRNLTERKMAEDELKLLAAELSEADRNKTTFLATLAHELRNPLSPIKNTVQLLSREPLDEDVHSLLDVVERQVEQMTRLIDDLMDISRISRGKVELRREVVLLEKIVESAVEASQPIIDASGQSLNLINNAVGIRLYADPTRISQVVSNLLNNASKFSPQGGAIELSMDCNADFVEIRVKDEGMGIQQEDLEHVFTMFSQVAETVERGSSGLGIGLTLVRNFVELHNGTVVADSEGKGRGSCFTVRLPIAKESGLPSKDEVMECDAVTRSFRVLVVDDTRAITFVMQRLLQSLHQEVRTADNGATAIETMVDFHPDIIFSDISMPGMNGYELAKHIRSTDALKSIFMVAMTGFGQPTDRQKALAAGFDEHVVKPVDFSVIVQLLQSRTNALSS